MLLLLHGQDTFRSRAALQETIQSSGSSGKTRLEVTVLDVNEISLEAVAQELVALSMFRRLLVFTHAFYEKRIRDFFLSHRKFLLETDYVIVFFEEGEIAAKDPLFQFVAKNGKTQKFSPLTGALLDRWLHKEGTAYGLDISREAITALFSCHGGDLWALSQEMRKLAAFKKSQSSKTVSPEDVRTLSLQASSETDIFSTIDAIARQKNARALELVHKHLANGDSPLYLFSMIHFQFRNILAVKDFKREHTLMHPFVFKKSRELAALLSLEELKAIYEKIWRFDIAVKTGVMEGEVALDAFLLGA